MILESKRSVQQTTDKSLFITLNRQWCNYAGVTKGTKLITLHAGDLFIGIPENSPLATPEGLKRFKTELLLW